MLFNSYPFLFVFLPIALLGYQVAGRFHRKAVVAWLGLISLAFYAWWHPAFLLVLLASIAINYTAAALISRQIPNKVSSTAWLWAAIAANLAALGYFKYFFPLLSFFSPHHPWLNVALPLGISFFTFTQIAFLVDLHQGVAKQQDLLSYVLFVTFFPHLIAGPILHHRDMMPQFQQSRRYQLSADDLAVGLAWFILGLAKKVLLADSFARPAGLVFSLHGPLAPATAWLGALAYALQLYFDFSGYSDMALGLARMFSIDFPLNFNSPYKAASIIEFWQRWHITLSQYINAYLYTPLQQQIRAHRRAAGRPVNRAALSTPGGFAIMIAAPTLTAMLIAGIWHGAGLQFLLFGLLHGTYLTLNHAWNLRHPQAAPRSRPRHAASVLLTFLSVLSTWVFFRAESTRAALTLLRSMLFGYRNTPLQATPISANAVLFLALGFLIVWFLPNTQQILSRFSPALHPELIQPQPPPRIHWQPTAAWALALTALLFVSLVRLQDPSTFLYFQF